MSNEPTTAKPLMIHGDRLSLGLDVLKFVDDVLHAAYTGYHADNPHDFSMQKLGNVMKRLHAEYGFWLPGGAAREVLGWFLVFMNMNWHLRRSQFNMEPFFRSLESALVWGYDPSRRSQVRCENLQVLRQFFSAIASGELTEKDFKEETR